MRQTWNQNQLIQKRQDMFDEPTRVFCNHETRVRWGRLTKMTNPKTGTGQPGYEKQEDQD